MINLSTDHLDNWRIKEIEEGGYWILPAHRSSRDQKSRKVVNNFILRQLINLMHKKKQNKMLIV